MAQVDPSLERTEPITGAKAFFMVSFFTIALYNFIELNFIIVATFKRRKGVYFWSFVVATWGIAPYTIGFLLRAFYPSINSYLYVTLIIVGWWPLVTGQSMVLWSRLHLILHKPEWLRVILGMIIVNAIICYVPTTILVYGANSSNPGPFINPYSIYEKIQVTLFFLQEMIMSGIYIVETIKMLRLTAITGRLANRKMLKHLVAVSIMVALLDMPILILEYAGLYDWQTAYKVAAYSTKLKLEFSILNNLVNLMQDRKRSHSGTARSDNTNRETVGSGGIILERPAYGQRYSV